MSENLRVGPALIFLGDPTQDDGSGNGTEMNYVGKTRGEVTINPQVEIAIGRADQTGTTPLADAVHFSGLRPVVNAPIVDEDKSKLQEILVNSNLENQNSLEAIGFGSGFKSIDKSSLKTLCVLPIKDLNDYAGENGNEDPDAYWFPLVVARDYGEFTFNLPEGDDVLNPHEVQFAGLYTKEDQASTSIPSSMRAMFRGAPNAGGLNWYLPDLSEIL